jgi:hypothetical protein
MSIRLVPIGVLSAASCCLAFVAFPAAGQENKDDALSAAVTKAASEGIDLFVERMVLKGKATNDHDWAVATGLYRAIGKKAEELGCLEIRGLDYMKFPVLAADTVNDKDLFPDPKRALAHKVSANGFGRCFILCTGPVEAELAGAGYTMIFANGNIKIAASLSLCILVSDGDVEIGGGLTQSIIVARGNIRVGSITDSLLFSGHDTTLPDSSTTRSRIIARGSIDIFGFIRDSTLLAGGTIRSEPVGADSTAKEKQKAVPKLVDFFDPASVGIEVGKAEGQLAVRDVPAGKPFANARIKKGDVIVAINGTRVDSPEEFRRVLRRAVAEGKGVLAVRRDGKSLEFSVEWHGQ